MISVVVSLKIVPDQRERFHAAIRANATSAVRDEPGCLGFEVCEDVQDDEHYLLYERYRDEDAIEAHRATPHYAAWREAVDVCVVPGSLILHRAAVLVREPG
jgi:(4S)-4-hydroxy-5-phosphonooxypentane-2,3-dione isomerase